MFLYNLSLHIIQHIFLLRIVKCDPRMPESVQSFTLGQMFLIMPVIEEIVMQECTSDQIMLITSDPQFSVEQETVACHAYNMTVHCHIAMLNMPSCPLKIFRAEYIRTMLLQ